MANDVLRFPRFFNGRLQIVDVPFARSTDIVSSNRLVAPYDFMYEDDLPYDMDGHGTHVTGTIGQLANAESGVGVAYNARIMPLKVCLGEWEVLFAARRGRRLRRCRRSSRAASASRRTKRAPSGMRPTTAPRCINISIGGDDAVGGHAERPAVRRVARRLRDAVGRQPLRGGQPARRIPALYARDISGVMAVGGRRPGPQSRVLLDHRRLHRDRGAGRQHPRRRRRGPRLAADVPRRQRSASTSSRPASTCSKTMPTRARRWPRRTSPGWRRCCTRRGSATPRPSRPRSGSSPPTAAPPAATTSTASASSDARATLRGLGIAK